MAPRQTARKARVTMTIEPKTVEALDRLVKTHGLPSRSKALEVALSYWLAAQKRQQVEQEIEAYYRPRSAKEEREDREWAAFASREARHHPPLDTSPPRPHSHPA